MELYSVIQFSSVLILYIIGVEMGTYQFLYVDLFITTILAVVMGRSGPANRLSTQRPLSSLMSPANIIPLLLQILLTIFIQYFSLYILQHEPWYVPTERAVGDEEIVECWEDTAIYIISCYQYIVLSMTYSKGTPHRQPVYKNWMYMATVVLLFGFNTILLFPPCDVLAEYFELKPLFLDDSIKYRIILLCLSFVQLVFSLMIEHSVSGSFWFKWCRRKLLRKKAFKNKYKTMETQILNSRFWDPLSF